MHTRTPMRLWIAGLLVAGAGLTPAATQAAMIAPVDGTHVAQRGGLVVFDELVQGRERLYQSVHGTVSAVPVPPSRLPFDASLGTDAHGRLVAVYSRCKVGGHGWPSDAVVPGSCDLFSYDLRTRRERRLTEADSRDASEAAASLDHGTLVFARNVIESARPPRHDSNVEGLRFRTRLYIRRLGTHQRSRRLFDVPGRDSAISTSTYDVDVNATAVSTRRGVAAAVFLPGSDSSAIYFKSPGGRVRRLAVGGLGEENIKQHDSPSFAGRYLYWSYSNQDNSHPPNGYVVRRDLATGATTAARAPGYLDAVAADPVHPAAALIVSSFSDIEPDSGARRGVDAVQTLDAPTFGPAPRSIGLHR